MRKLLSLFSFSLVLLLFVAPALAQDDSRTEDKEDRTRDRIEERKEKKEERRATREDKREEKRATREAKREERREERKAKRDENIRRFFDRMATRVEAAIARIEKLIERIQSRLAKIESEGRDASKIKAKVEEAKTKLGTAKTEFESAKGELDNVVEGDNPKDAFAQTRDKIQSVKKHLTEIHRTLVSIIGDIKGLRVGQNRSPKPSLASPAGGSTP